MIERSPRGRCGGLIGRGEGDLGEGFGGGQGVAGFLGKRAGGIHRGVAGGYGTTLGVADGALVAEQPLHPQAGGVRMRAVDGDRLGVIVAEDALAGHHNLQVHGRPRHLGFQTAVVVVPVEGDGGLTGRERGGVRDGVDKVSVGREVGEVVDSGLDVVEDSAVRQRRREDRGEPRRAIARVADGDLALVLLILEVGERGRHVDLVGIHADTEHAVVRANPVTVAVLEAVGHLVDERGHIDAEQVLVDRRLGERVADVEHVGAGWTGP
nr:hypothetical protein [Cryobacterium psychrophilum]